MATTTTGLAKLQDASETVDVLSKGATVQRSTLAEKQTAADNAMTEITNALEEASGIALIGGYGRHRRPVWHALIEYDCQHRRSIARSNWLLWPTPQVSVARSN